VNERGLYVHVPFCSGRCRYCGFYAEVGREGDLDRYIDAVVAELRQRTSALGWEPLASVFIGGGTPSLLSPAHVERVLAEVRRSPGLREDAEVTLEANPGSSGIARLAGYRSSGVNRLSLGVQSFDAETLRWLGRRHTVEDALRACAAARDAGFGVVSLDLLAAVPGMPACAWERTLATALRLRPEHVSVYCLSVEPGTALAAQVDSGAVAAPDEEAQARAYELGCARLSAAGYEHYEISNFAVPGHRCRHNWACWRGQEYLGVGAAAHSSIGAVRSWNYRSLDRYLASIEQGRTAQAGQEQLSPAVRRQERLWLELRTCDGAVLTAAEAQALETHPRLRSLMEAGVLRWRGGRLQVDGAGWLLADALAIEAMDLVEGRRAAPGEGRRHDPAPSGRHDP